MASVAVIEAFFGGSHKVHIETIFQDVDKGAYDLFMLPAKKWHWRARTSAIYFAQTIPRNHQYKVLFTTSVLNLAELIGMRTDLVQCKKIVYFHENQLIYPVREIKERDCQFGLNEIMTSLAADVILFNSKFNETSFLENIKKFINKQSDVKVMDFRGQIESKCMVLYFPIDFDGIPNERVNVDVPMANGLRSLHFVWPHRWEHDKNPQLLVNTLIELDRRQIPFTISIVGEQFESHPTCLDEIKKKLAHKLRHFGYLSRSDYIRCLNEADVVISTANHEFYGVSMLEAIHCGCVPIAPNKLVYPEIYPKNLLYNTEQQLTKMLQNWCKNPNTVFRTHRDKFFASFSLQKFSSQILIPQYLDILTLSDAVRKGHQQSNVEHSK